MADEWAAQCGGCGRQYPMGQFPNYVQGGCETCGAIHFRAERPKAKAGADMDKLKATRWCITKYAGGLNFNGQARIHAGATGEDTDEPGMPDLVNLQDEEVLRFICRAVNFYNQHGAPRE